MLRDDGLDCSRFAVTVGDQSEIGLHEIEEFCRVGIGAAMMGQDQEVSLAGIRSLQPGGDARLEGITGYECNETPQFEPHPQAVIIIVVRYRRGRHKRKGDRYVRSDIDAVTCIEKIDLDTVAAQLLDRISAGHSCGCYSSEDGDVLEQSVDAADMIVVAVCENQKIDASRRQESIADGTGCALRLAEAPAVDQYRSAIAQGGQASLAMPDGQEFETGRWRWRGQEVWQ